MSEEPTNTAPDAVAEIRKAVEQYTTSMEWNAKQVAKLMRTPHGAGGMSNQPIINIFMARVYRYVPELLARYDALEAENERLKQELDDCRK